MRRCRLFPLLALVAVGCCGSQNAPKPVVDYPALGAEAMDLTISGGVQGTATSMKGIGAARGKLEIVSPWGDGVSIHHIQAVLQATKATNGTQLTQTLTLGLNDPATLTVGAVFLLDGTTNAAEYDERRTHGGGEINGDSSTDIWRVKSGKVEVSSLSGGVVTLRLTNATFFMAGTDDPATAPTANLSGALTGTVVVAFDLG